MIYFYLIIIILSIILIVYSIVSILEAKKISIKVFNKVKYTYFYLLPKLKYSHNLDVKVLKNRLSIKTNYDTEVILDFIVMYKTRLDENDYYSFRYLIKSNSNNIADYFEFTSNIEYSENEIIFLKLRQRVIAYLISCKASVERDLKFGFEMDDCILNPYSWDEFMKRDYEFCELILFYNELFKGMVIEC